MSVVTVRRRAASFRNKIGAVNRTEAVAIAAGMGWFEHPALRLRAGSSTRSRSGSCVSDGAE